LEKNRIYIFLQWKPLNVITNNGVAVVTKLTQISKPVPTNPLFFLCISRKFLLIINRLMLSLYLSPKVITLSSFHCLFKISRLLSLNNLRPSLNESRICLLGRESLSGFLKGNRIRFSISGWNHLVNRIKLNQIKRLTTPK
jgi:hypothetical protein